MQVISLAHERGWESVTLDKREIAALAEHHHLMRVGDYAVLYETRRHNPLFSRDVAERRAGATGCAWCGHARTPSNAHLHAECDKWLELAS